MIEEYKLCKGSIQKREKDSTIPIATNTVSPARIEITQWNGRSIHSETKTSYIQSLPGQLIAIQEVWQRLDRVMVTGDLIDAQIRKTKQGGGTATLRNDKIINKVLNKVEISKDSNAIKLKVQNSYLWLINLYLPQGKCSKFQKLFGRIRKSIPQNEWQNVIIIGDFNIDLNKNSENNKLLAAIAKQLGMTIATPKENTRLNAKLDYLIHGTGIKIIHHQVLPSPSDHKAVWWSLEVASIKRNKTLKIPNRRCADEIMIELLQNKKVKNPEQFFQGLDLLRRRKRRNLFKLVRRKKYQLSSLFDQLLQIQEPEETKNAINNYWGGFWIENEGIRYSKESAIAYQNLRKILKYHLYEKRDGAIINCLMKDDKEVTYDSKEIEQNLLQTMYEIQVDEKWPWIEQKPFPKLKEIDREEALNIIDGLATNKAIAYDGCSDILFRNNKRKKEKYQKLTAKKLKDLWRLELDKLHETEETWDTRLVPLNKVFPNIPTRTQLRPIVVQSPLIKLMESRFLRKLQNYASFKLDRSQTGFVPGIGIQVNLTRALDRIKLRTNRKQPVYGLFIDFSNAYNSVPHSRLFEKLREKKILEEEEVQFIEQMYARFRLKLGNSKLRCNKGVAQGSVISPSLFDIYIEDLSDELLKTAVHREDILYYADDILVLCTSPSQVEECIQTIEEWSKLNGMNLNKNKSGVVIFGDRKTSKIPKMQRKNEPNQNSSKGTWAPTQSCMNGVPICSKYKYLGTWLDNKLTCGPQIGHIRKKAAHLYVKLYPYLSNCSADARRDMWQTMVAPLFNAALILLEFEPSICHKRNLERLWRMTFKQFMLISKRTNTYLVEEIIRKDLGALARETVKTSREQWEQRKSGEPITAKLPYTKKLNGLRGVPNTFCKLLNTQVKPCPRCIKKGEVTSPWHLKYSHGIQITHVNKIWKEEILPITEDLSIKRQEIAERIGPIIQNHLLQYDKAIEYLLSNKEEII